MRNLTIFLAILFSSVLSCFAQDKLAGYWDKGNDFYNKKIYDSAAYYFEQIASLKPQKAEVYYNLGNTYYRLNKIGPAVLNYERALKIDPDHKAAKDNLMLTQNRISNNIQTSGEIFFLKWWNSITRPNKSTTWAITALVIFTLIIVVMLLRKFNTQFGPSIPVQTIFILGVLWIWFITIAIIAANKMIQKTGAVVMQNETPLMNNELKGKPITQIPEGTTITILSDKDTWVEVRIPDGRVGMIQQNLIEKI